MNQDEFELHIYSKESFSQKMLLSVYHALKFRFPYIVELDVYLDNDYNPCVCFQETENIKSVDVTNFLEQLKKETHANQHR